VELEVCKPTAGDQFGLAVRSRWCRHYTYWTAADGVAEQHCRKNHRLFRLKVLSAAHPLEPKFEVLRVTSLEDTRGTRIGQYRTRTDASKAVAEVAFKEEWD
jgi:hypothetical protein